jgi:hypothetical protein
MAAIKKASALDRYILIAFVATPSVYYLGLWAISSTFSPRGEANYCYVVTPTTAYLRATATPNKAQIDLETGLPCKPVTAEQLPRIQKLVDLRKQGRAVKPIQPKAEDFFSAITGEPLLWYVRDGEQYRFYDVPGFDALTGETLQPVTKDVSRIWRLGATSSPTPSSSASSESGGGKVEEGQKFEFVLPGTDEKGRGWIKFTAPGKIIEIEKGSKNSDLVIGKCYPAGKIYNNTSNEVKFFATYC